jgi:hypothetical protein
LSYKDVMLAQDDFEFQEDAIPFDLPSASEGRGLDKMERDRTAVAAIRAQDSTPCLWQWRELPSGTGLTAGNWTRKASTPVRIKTTAILLNIITTSAKRQTSQVENRGC